jgi:3-oxoacyl-[acyl-carrier-protein] synthase-1
MLNENISMALQTHYSEIQAILPQSIYLSAPGLICCAGRDRDELYESCLAGNQSGMVMRELPDGLKFPTGQINRDLPQMAPCKDSSKIIRIMDYALEQIRDDIEKVIASYGPDRVGLTLGSCDNCSEGSLKAHEELIAKGSFPEGYDYSQCFHSASAAAEYIADKFGIKGPVMNIVTACASGSSAIIRGAEMIRARLCDAVIAGAADIVSEMVLMGFNSLEALSGSLTNPFSKNRKGINLGEGAVFFVLDANGETGGIELLGYGESCDAYHMTAPGSDGAGAAKAMKAAIEQAGITPEQIDYVNLHGTGTPLNDKAEALAMKAVFGGRKVPASSTKPVMGHAQGAAGALETAVCWMAIKGQKGYPVHCWDGEEDGELGFVPFPSRPQALSAPVSICMNNNFGFGGCNVSLIIGRR